MKIKKFLAMNLLFLICAQLMGMNVVRAGNEDYLILFMYLPSIQRARKVRIKKSSAVSMLHTCSPRDCVFVHDGEIMMENVPISTVCKDGSMIIAAENNQEKLCSWMRVTKDSNALTELTNTKLNSIFEVGNRLKDVKFLRTEGEHIRAKRVIKLSNYSDNLDNQNRGEPTVIPEKPNEVSSDPLPIWWLSNS